MQVESCTCHDNLRREDLRRAAQVDPENAEIKRELDKVGTCGLKV